MTQKNKMLDERLVAYLDGELVPDAHKKLAEVIKGDPALQQRIRELEFDRNALKQAFGNLATPDFSAQIALLQQSEPASAVEVASSAPPSPETSVAPPARTATAPANDNKLWRIGKPLIAAGLLVATFAAGLYAQKSGFGLPASTPQVQIATANTPDTDKPAPKQPGWRQAVANYMSLYTKSTLDRTPVTVESNDRTLTVLSRDIQLDLSAAQNQIDDLQLYRGQILNLRGKPLVQLAYLDDGKTPVAFCIVKNTKGASSMKYEKRNGMNIAHWSSASHSFMVIGDLPEARIADIAAKLSVDF